LDDEQFASSAVLGLDEFSHLEVVFHFDRIDPAEVRSEPRSPRGNPAWSPVGVFAHRGPYRPNLLGVSCCRSSASMAWISTWPILTPCPARVPGWDVDQSRGRGYALTNQSQQGRRDEHR
jgi:hypothetical protein